LIALRLLSCVDDLTLCVDEVARLTKDLRAEAASWAADGIAPFRAGLSVSRIARLADFFRPVV
jgi:hypothetical protein